AQPLAHPAGVAADAAAAGVRQADDFEDLVDAGSQRGTVEPVQATDQLEQLTPAHPAVEPRVLVEVADHALSVRRAVADADAQDLGGAIARLRQRGEDAKRRRLARV